MVFSFSEYTIKSIRGLKCYLEKQFQPTELYGVLSTAWRLDDDADVA